MQHPPHHHLVSTFYIFRHTHKLLSILSTSPKKRKERSSCSDTFHLWAVTTTATSQWKVQRGKKLSVPPENNLSFARYLCITSKCSVVFIHRMPPKLYILPSLLSQISQLDVILLKKGGKNMHSKTSCNLLSICSKVNNSPPLKTFWLPSQVYPISEQHRSTDPPNKGEITHFGITQILMYKSHGVPAAFTKIQTVH